MRFPLVVPVTLILAACGTTTPTSSVVVGTRLPPVVVEQGDLIGLDAAALLTRFGRPRLQVKEGDGTKLQFAGSSCLLDAYLYPQGGTPRVTHVDTRNRDGRDVPQATCIAMLAPR